MRFIPFLFLFFSLPSFAQQTQITREKLYLHLDKPTYALGDTLWFKAYLTDASNHSASPLSGIIYTELIHSNTGTVVQQLSLPTALGLTWGSFVLDPIKYKSGNYTIRAYTNWMQNFGESHFFRKDIKILSLLNEPVPNSSPSQSQEIDLQFLPEGGKIMEGISQKIAFKAIDANGKGVKIHGEILDSKQNKVVDFNSNGMGMGYLNLLPTNDEKYVAKIKYGNLIKEVELPKAQQNGTLLQVTNHYKKDSIKITAYSSELLEREINLIGQSRGQTHFTSKIKFNTNIKFIYIPKNIFPTGVSQIVLMDGNRTLNERNFFINRKDELNLSISSPATVYGTRDSIPIELSVFDSIGKPVEGSFSIAITDDTQVAKDSVNDANILSYLLLSSNLKGEIEKPGYYFHQADEQKHNDLEALMLTQGWVSYNWDSSKKPSFKAEKEFTLSGRVHGVLQKPVPNAKMTMLGKNKGMVMLNTIANEKGEFTFNDLPLMDSAMFIIQAKNTKDKAGALTIQVDEFITPKVNLSPKRATFSSLDLDSVSTNLIAVKKEEAKINFKDAVSLDEVKIVGKRVVKGSRNLNGPGEADQTITEEELNKISKKTLFDLLNEKVKGFNLKYNTPRGFFIGFDTVKFVFDGINVDRFYDGISFYTRLPSASTEYYNYLRSFLDNFQAEDIRGIEVMSSYGNRSRYRERDYDILTNRWVFVEITTKLGKGPFTIKTPNIYIYRPMNYGDTKTFYHPRYTAVNKTDKKPDFRSTLYWNPNLLTDEKGNAQTSFFSADKKGSYTVWVEGSDMQGNFGFKTFKLIIN